MDIDINLKNDDGNTALMLVRKRGDLEIIEYLLDHGADVNEKDIVEQWY
jgi:ankyrin repeat protein